MSHLLQLSSNGVSEQQVCICCAFDLRLLSVSLPAHESVRILFWPDILNLALLWGQLSNQGEVEWNGRRKRSQKLEFEWLNMKSCRLAHLSRHECLWIPYFPHAIYDNLNSEKGLKDARVHRILFSENLLVMSKIFVEFTSRLSITVNLCSRLMIWKYCFIWTSSIEIGKQWVKRLETVKRNSEKNSQLAGSCSSIAKSPYAQLKKGRNNNKETTTEKTARFVTPDCSLHLLVRVCSLGQPTYNMHSTLALWPNQPRLRYNPTHHRSHRVCQPRSGWWL